VMPLKRTADARAKLAALARRSLGRSRYWSVSAWLPGAEANAAEHGECKPPPPSSSCPLALPSTNVRFCTVAPALCLWHCSRMRRACLSLITTCSWQSRAWVTVGFTVTAALASPKPPSPNYAYYKNPHSLSGVAHRYHLKVSDIAVLNGIKDPDRFNAYGLKLPDTAETRSLPRYVPWAVATPRELCRASPWTFTKARKPGCAEAWCGNGRAGGQGCLCVLEVGARMELAWKDGSRTNWVLDPSVFYSFGPETVDVVSVDLDGDGEPETLASWLTGISNGIGQEYRTLIVFRSGKEIARYDSGGATAHRAAVRVNGLCHLTSSHYESAPEPLRGLALYLVERTFDPITMTMDREIIGTRAAESNRFVIPFDPILEEHRASTSTRLEKGTILSFEENEELDEATVIFRTASGSRRLHFERFSTSLRLGDSKTRRLFPQDLVWPGVSGRTVRFEQGGELDRNIIWLVP